MSDDQKLAAMQSKSPRRLDPRSSYSGGASDGPLSSSFTSSGPAPIPPRKALPLPRAVVQAINEARLAGPAPAEGFGDVASRLLADGAPTFEEIAAGTHAALSRPVTYRPGQAFSQTFAPSSAPTPLPAPVQAWQAQTPAASGPLPSAIRAYAALAAQGDPADAPHLANMWGTLQGLAGDQAQAAGDDD